MKLENQALNREEVLQRILKATKSSLDKTKEKLANEGWEVEFDYYYDRLEEDAVCACKAKKEGNKFFVQAVAMQSEDDIEVELVGKYLSLARVADIIFG